MIYTIADILLFIGLLAVLWIVLYRTMRWWTQRNERSENADLIRSVEDQINQNVKKRKE